ncbi:CDP-glucose 4,6-dehydratase [Sphingobium tyrosinilyticum]|uniref:CDP-glucose 4,6-dehydratase n=1 Tax=Sphingobium tyrosinilyticum TaxID=2715436 RepID=A0ABV9EY69_9SPHN
MQALFPSSTFWRGKRVLLTGHTGFKGGWAAMWLELLGAEVYGLALSPAGASGGEALWHAIGRPGNRCGFADIRDAAAVEAAFVTARPDVVLHMAAQALVHASYEDPVTTFDTNVMGLINVLEVARRSPGLKAIVNVTSDKCYENTEQVWAYRETEPMGGSDPYSASKGCAELVTASYRRSFFNRPEGPLLASARAGNVIGGGDWSPDRLVPDCVRSFSRQADVLIRNPLSTRPWQHVLEPITGYLMLAQALIERGADAAQGWNFGPPDDDAWPVGRIVDALAEAWGSGVGWGRDETVRPHEAMLLRVDASKARLGLGWRPRLPIGEGLAWTVDWYKSVAAGQSARTVTMNHIRAYEALSGAAK